MVTQLTAFPADRKRKHSVLMQAVEDVRPVLEAAAPEGAATERCQALRTPVLLACFASTIRRVGRRGPGTRADAGRSANGLRGWCLMIEPPAGVSAFLRTANRRIFGAEPPRTAGVRAFGMQCHGREPCHRRCHSPRNDTQSGLSRARAHDGPGHPGPIRVTSAPRRKLHERTYGPRGPAAATFLEDLFVPTSFLTRLTDRNRCAAPSLPLGPARIRYQRARGLRSGRGPAGAGRHHRGGAIQDPRLRFGKSPRSARRIPAHAQRKRSQAARHPGIERGDPRARLASCLR